MKPIRTDLHDAKVDRKVVISALWISMLFVFAYVDIFGFFRADILNGALAGTVPGIGATIDQTFLNLTTLYILVPSLMVVVSLLAPARANRIVNTVVSLLYVGSIAVAAVGETWAYYLVGSVVEVALLLTITGLAWTWPAQANRPTPSQDAIAHVGATALRTAGH